MKKLLLILLSSSLLSACVLTPAELVWPNDIPSLEYYRGYYAKDIANQKVLNERKYLQWIKKFYQGSALYRRGWNTMIDELVASFDDNKRKTLIQKKMNLLGKRISAEWAKDSRYRLISTRHVSIWGNALLESINRNEQLILISKVEQDVNALLARAINRVSINPGRYYQASKLDDF